MVEDKDRGVAVCLFNILLCSGWKKNEKTKIMEYADELKIPKFFFLSMLHWKKTSKKMMA